MINFEELDIIVKQFKATPEIHDQKHYFAQVELGEQGDFCGTTCCVAGLACLRAGWVPNFSQGYAGATATVRRGSVTDDAVDVAQDVLGLNESQANELFYCFGGIQDIEAIIDGWRND